MSRIRSVHPGLWTDEAFVCLSDAAQIFFIGLWTECDDQGAFEWKPIQLRLKLRGNRDGSVEPILAELEAANCIVSYEIGGRKFGLVRNFCRFQRPQKPKLMHVVPDHLLSFVNFKEGDDDLRKRKSEEQDGKCFYCETGITHYSKKANSLEIDHKWPLSRGGDDSEDNLVAACRNCNRAKHDMSADEFIAKMRDAKELRCENDTVAREKDPKPSDNNAKQRMSQQMEDGGGRMEEEEVDLCCVPRASSLEVQLREAANWQSNPSPNLFITGPIEALIEAGADLERDVLPVIRAIAPRCRNPNWKYFLDAIADARDQRLAAASNSATIIPINPQNPRISHGPNWKKPSRDDSFAAIDAAIDELERRQRS